MSFSKDILMDLMLLYDITPAEKACLDLNKLSEKLVSSIWKYDKKYGLSQDVRKIVQENYDMCFVWITAMICCVYCSINMFLCTVQTNDMC